MSKSLTRYWFNSKTRIGVGVTAYNLDEAISLIKQNKLAMRHQPDFSSVIESIDIEKLDQNHVIPNMGICSNYGIWFPNLN